MMNRMRFTVLAVLFYTTLVAVTFAQTQNLFGTTSKGVGTWHVASSIDAGACSIRGPPPSGVTAVAIYDPMWYGSETCGMCAQIFYPGAPLPPSTVMDDKIPPTQIYYVYVVDKCVGCDVRYGSGFDVYSPIVLNGAWTVNWTAIQCPFNDKISYEFEGGQNAYYIKLQLRFHIVPIKSLTITYADGTSKLGERSDDNHFVFTNVPNTLGPYNLTITGVNGEVLKDRILTQANLVVQGNGVQFARTTSTTTTTSTTAATTSSTTSSSTGSSANADGNADGTSSGASHLCSFIRSFE